MIKAFFSCSSRGDFLLISKAKIGEIKSLFKNIDLGIDTKRDLIVNANLSDKNKNEIHDFNYEKMMSSDLGIFEISNPSTSLGMEISEMINLKKPTICFYRKDFHKLISFQILGKENSKYVNSPFEVYPYENLEDIKNKIEDFCRKYKLT
jgi:hypothetical protein